MDLYLNEQRCAAVGLDYNAPRGSVARVDGRALARVLEELRIACERDRARWEAVVAKSGNVRLVSGGRGWWAAQ